jgi:predicted DCC family thiol-disulfide oxidoreductase YuxK
VRQGLTVLVYDGDCGFCTRSAAWLQRHAPTMVVVAWQRADLASLDLTEGQCREAVQLVDGNGRASGGRAIAVALGRCRQPYRAGGALLAWRPLHPLVERAYALVAANRHRLPGSTCALSDGDERSVPRPSGHGASLPVAPVDR